MGSNNRSKSPSTGAIGGAADEAGSHLRASVGASLAAAVIRGCAVSDAGLEITDLGPARAISAETDDPLDDLVVVTDEGRVLVQVKRRLSLAQRDGPTSAALDQLARAGRAGLGPGDRLLIAHASGTNEVAALRSALDRRRKAAHSGAPTSAEQAALRKLTDRLDERLDDVLQREAVLDALHLWETDPTQGDGRAALAGRLEGAVCATGAGEQAARELTDLVRELARTRSGEDAVGLVVALAARDVPLSATADRAEPTAAAAALLRHRERVVRAGTTLGLFGAVPPALADLPLADVDAGVQVDRPDDARDLGHDLIPTLRRRGRALLIGDAGGGKSTALRATAAEWGRRPSWPVPIPVHLRRLSSPGEEPTAQLLKAACADLPSAERSALTAGLERALSRGECLVLLDGLDEVRQHRQALLERLGKWLRELHPGCEVLIATRPVSAEDATAWDLPHLHLKPPNHPMRAVDAILDAVASAEGHEETWKEERRAWVHAALAHDGDLRSTPLTIVSITLLAVTSSDPSDLPTERARVLQQVLVNVLARDVSIREGDLPTIGALEGTEAKYALEDALRVVAEPVLTGAPQVEEAKTKVAGVLSELFDLPLRRAEAAADDALLFWKRLGILAEDDGVIVGKVRPLVEVAHGWRIAASEPARHEPLIAEARAEPVLWPCLGLAAGLSSEVMATWAAAVGVDGTADELIALLEARASGAELSEDDLTALALTSGARLLAQADDAERIAEALLTVPWTPAMLAELRPQLKLHVPTERGEIVEVLETIALDPADAVDVDLLRRFVQAPAPPDPGRAAASDGALEWFLAGGDVGHSRAKEAALVALATRDRADAELALASFEDGSVDLRTRLAAALRSHGLDHEVNAADLQLKRDRPLAWFDPDAYRAVRRELLETAVALGERTALTRRAERRLEALSSVWNTAGLPWVNENWSVERRDRLHAWLCAVTLLGGQDPAVVAGQARLVLDELAADDESGDDVIGDTPSVLVLDGWDRVSDTRELLVTLMDCLGTVPREASRSWFYAVVTCPDRFAVAELIRERRPRFRIWARELLAFGSLLVAETPESEAGELLSSSDPFDRSGAAEWWSWEVRSRRPLPAAILECATDTDRNVRASLLNHLKQEHVDDELRAVLTTMRTAERIGWRCRWCAEDNPPEGGENGGCTGCQSNGPDLRALDELLGGERRPHFPRVARRPRRIRLPTEADPLF